jgi:hypothetical protein
MKNLFILLCFIFVSNIVNAGTCTAISRTEFVDGNTLSASDLNTQFGTAYSSINAADGGCIIDGSVELAALGTTEFSPQLKGIRRGCIVDRTATSSMLISKCLATVNNLNVATATSTSVTYANLDAGSIATGTSYYVYISTGSTGTTLTPKISATAPDDTGYNTSGDMFLAKFITNPVGEIQEGSVYNFDGVGYNLNKGSGVERYYIGLSGEIESFGGGYIQSCVNDSTGTYTCTSTVDYAEAGAGCWVSSVDSRRVMGISKAAGVGDNGEDIFSIDSRDMPSGNLADALFNLYCTIELKRN